MYHWVSQPPNPASAGCDAVATNDIGVVPDRIALYALGGENIEPATRNTTPWLRIGQIAQLLVNLLLSAA